MPPRLKAKDALKRKKNVRNGASAKKAPTEVAARERRSQVVALRVDGLTFAAIGEELGFSTQRAYQLWQEALDAIVRPVAEVALNLELERCERMMAAIWPKATAGDLDAIRGALAIMARRARYLGLDAPVKVDGDVQHHVDGNIRHEFEVTFVKAAPVEEAKTIEHAANGKGNGHG